MLCDSCRMYNFQHLLILKLILKKMHWVHWNIQVNTLKKHWKNKYLFKKPVILKIIIELHELELCDNLLLNFDK